MGPEAGIRPTRVEIDIDALCANATTLRHIAAGAGLVAVVKADGYGHGAVEIARALSRARQVAGFAVSLVEEGVCLRDAGIRLPILVMGPALAGGHGALLDHGLTPMISDLGDLAAIDEQARARDVRADVHIKLDTGMSRLGIRPGQLDALIARIGQWSNLDITGACTHFACADTDDPDDPTCMTHDQIRRFDTMLDALGRAGVTPRVAHMANSAGTLYFPAARRDLVRCGLALYGNGARTDAPRGPHIAETVQGPAPAHRADHPGIPLQPVMRLVSHVAQVRDASPGDTVSYGASWRATRPTRLAVLPIGYGDGLPRRLTGKASALIHGRRFPVVGAICMDMAVVDVTDSRDDVRPGDEAVLLGRQGQACITAREWARAVGYTEYEVTCGISRRVPRVYSAARSEPAPDSESSR